MARKIFSLLICALFVALCATSALADEVSTDTSSPDDIQYESISTGSPLFWYGVYDSNDILLDSGTSTRTSGLNVSLPPQADYGAPYMCTSYGVNLPNFTWSSSYTYLFTFSTLQGFTYNNANYTPPYTRGRWYQDEDFLIGTNRQWKDSNAGYLEIEDITSYFQVDYAFEPYSIGSNHGRTETYSVMFKFDDVSQIDTYVNFLCTNTLRADGMSSSFHYFFSKWNITAFYDPEGNITIDDEEVVDIVQGQKEAVEYGLELERQEIQSSADSVINPTISEANQVFDLHSFSSALGNLANALGETGTSFTFQFPSSGEIPFLGSLWDSQTIPLKEYIDMIPQPVIYIIRFLAWLALMFSCVHQIRTIIDDLNGGED